MDLMQILAGQLGGGAMQQLSQQLGADQGATSKAVEAALPMLVSALARNAQSEQGASALAGALDKDHDGSILDNLGDLIGSGGGAAGAGILKHVLGGSQGNVQNKLARSTGLNSNQSSALLATLAPVVMGALGQQKRQQGLDIGGLVGMLTGAQQQSSGGMLGNLITGLLDDDDDDDDNVLGDIAGSLLGSLFK